MNQITQLLHRIPLFADVSDDALTSLAAAMQPITLTDGVVLFEQGERGDAFFIVETGHIDIFTREGDHKLILNRFGAGDSFGEMSLVDQKPRSASAVAAGVTQLLKLDTTTFLNVLQAQPQIAHAMLVDLSSKLRSSVAYIQQGAAWSRRIAAGEYESVRAEAEIAAQESAETRASDLVYGFINMAQGVQAREEGFKQQVQQLQIEIDQAKREQQVKAIVESADFKSIEQKAQRLRQRRAQRLTPPQP